MVQEFKVQGFDEFLSKVTELDKQNKVILCMFCGDKDASGNSWCPDCVVKEPVVRKALGDVPNAENVAFVYCSVGGREYWKDRSNQFRTDKNLKLTGVPTLMIWGRPNEKLVEDQIKADVISILFDQD
uniref:Thioredoxin domain-containing protein 17 n=1 Tax=Phallusia mammillata TaxID=59560 RepID=A0A6F9DX01_9ASCI|nr:thioredoxin domain-containing protein 17-like [Phallusia mammillata]